MARDNDSYNPPLYRHRRALEVMIELCKTDVIRLHDKARTLTGWQAKQVRAIADELDEHAEYLKERLQTPLTAEVPPPP